jgi:hypothetical protein
VVKAVNKLKEACTDEGREYQAVMHDFLVSIGSLHHYTIIMRWMTRRGTDRSF